MSTQKTVATVTAAPQPAQGGLPPAGATQRLKAERVQDPAPARLSRQEAEGRLPQLPGWRLAAKGRAVERERDLGTPEIAALYCNFVTACALALGVSAEVKVVGHEAVVLLYSTRSYGRKRVLSETILGFARLLG